MHGKETSSKRSDVTRWCFKNKNEGADAIQVSNHGGRQLESATSAINALPLIRKALGPEFPLIFDSGIRSGGDIVRALALALIMSWLEDH